MDKRWLWIILGSLVLGTVIVVVLIFALVGLPAAPSSSAAPPTPVRPSPSASATQAPTTPAAPEALTRAEATCENNMHPDFTTDRPPAPVAWPDVRQNVVEEQRVS